ncbi:MAG: DUF3516 domain-containing protein, partial [Verrucomicrobium sp.]|nr:DUF3516 domain-containing protein [Verrucomicrobium sp.]
QAPEHIIENAKMDAKAGGDPKKMRKMVKKKPPEGFVGWSEDTFKKLQSAAPEPLASRFQVSHGMLLQVLSREGDGCRAMQRLIADSHETLAAKKQHRKRGWELFRALITRKIIEILPKSEQKGGQKLRVNVALQDDFSLNYTLSLYLIDTLALIDPLSPSYAADVLTLCESILENPDTLLRGQLRKVKDEAMATMKADGVPYEERIERLEELEYPKPCRDFVYNTFNEFAALHPWVGQENIRPKSIAREMYENFRSFTDYINDYDLHRTEGVLLRHLSSVHKVLAQTVPDQFKTEPVQEMEAWLAGVLRGTDSSLLDEWERMRDPNWKPGEEEEAKPELAPDITRNRREFTALIRTEIFKFLRPLATESYGAAALALGSTSPAWNADALGATMDPYYEEHDRILLDAEARNGRHTYVEQMAEGQSWRVCQILVDAESLNDWQAEFRVDLTQAREEGKPTLVLVSLGPVVPI